VFSTLALAGTFAGRLLDVACVAEQKKIAGCDASSATTAFAIASAGTLYKLDADGNTKAAAALKNRADRAADPSKPQSMAVMAKIEGAQKEGTITVETIEVR
jgi:hypothetical protein